MIIALAFSPGPEMQCIFKSYGYIPSLKFCTHCEPLERIFGISGYNCHEISEASKTIMRARIALEADDMQRDENSILKRIIARMVRKMCELRMPMEVNRIVKEANQTIQNLEKTDADVICYLEKMSEIGGRIFQKSFRTRKPAAFSIGSIIAGAITAYDMSKDLGEDIKEGKFNPLKKASKPTKLAEDLLNKYSVQLRKIMYTSNSPTSFVNMTNSNEQKAFYQTATGCLLCAGGLLMCACVLVCCCAI
jgi:hypothetical protein